MIHTMISVLLVLSGFLLAREGMALPGYSAEVARLCINQPLPKPVFSVSDCLDCHSNLDGGSFTLNEDGRVLLNYHQDRSSDNLAKVLDAFCKGAYYNTNTDGALPMVWNSPQSPGAVGYLGSLEVYWLARLGTENQSLTLSKTRAVEQSKNLPGTFNLIAAPDNRSGQNMNFGLVSLNKAGNLTVTVEADQSQGSAMIPGFALYQGWDTGTEAARNGSIFFGENNPLGTEGLTYVGDALGDTPGGGISKTFYGLDAGDYEVFVTVGNNNSSSGPYTVTFQTTPPGTTLFIDPIPIKGTVTSDRGGLNCGTGGNTCSANFKADDQVTLTATPDTGNLFTGWSGACGGFGTTCTLTINGSKTVSAEFKAPSILTVALTNIKNGRVTSDPAGLDCPWQCLSDFNQGVSLKLTAIPNPGYRLAGWTGVCAGAGATCQLQAGTGSITVEARFELIFHTLTVATSGLGGVASDSRGIECGTFGNRRSDDCSEIYLDGDQVTLRSLPEAGQVFTGWSGACQGIGDCTLTLRADTSVTAAFTANGAIATAKGPCGPASTARLGVAPAEPVQLCSAGPSSTVISLKDGRFTWTCMGNGPGANGSRCFSLNDKLNQPQIGLEPGNIQTALGNIVSQKIVGGRGKGMIRVFKISTPGTRCRVVAKGRHVRIKTSGSPGSCALSVRKAKDRRFNMTESVPIIIEAR